MRARKTAPTPVGASILHCTEPEGYRARLLLGTPSLGTIRIEWHDAMAGVVMPANWQLHRITPLGFGVADGQNLIVQAALAAGVEWVWFQEDDTLPPPNLCLVWQEWMRKATQPVVSGLYYLRGGSGEPLIYRGVGTGAYTTWTPGDRVRCDGVPTGCLLVHASLFRVMAAEAPDYQLRANGGTHTLKKIFEEPRRFAFHPESGGYETQLGTSDLDWCHRVIRGQVLERAGWPKIAKLRWPFVVDTRIRCGHIERTTGVIS